MQISKLQTLDAKYWGNLTTETQLGAMHMLNPQLIDKRMEQLYVVNRGSDDFLSFVNKFPKFKVESETVPYKWMLIGDSEKNVALTGAHLTKTGAITGTDYITATSTSTPGIGISKFYMVWPERYFEVTSVIVGERPDSYSLRITAAELSGNKWVTEVELMTGDEELFVPVEDIVAGTYWSEEYGQVTQTLADHGNSTKHASHIMMENTLSTIRKEETIPGNMIRQGKNSPLAATFTGKDGKPITAWIDKQSWDMYSQFRNETAKLLLYGRSNKKADGSYANTDSNGWTIRSGAGLYEQVAPSNIDYYTDFSIDYLCEVAMGLTFGKVPEDSRTLVLSTGERGMYQFHKAIKDEASSITYLSSDKQLISKGADKLAIQGQFVEYSFVNGIVFKVMVDPMLDNPIRNKMLHPSGGLASSYEYNIWDFGTSNGQPNIQRTYLEGDEETFTYIAGTRHPFTMYNNNSAPIPAASPVDGYKVIRQFWGGMLVRNPLRAARLIPSLLYNV